MYNATCIITGKRDNLRMYAHRNDKGEMVGWVFIHESLEIEGMDIQFNLSIDGNVSVEQGG